MKKIVPTNAILIPTHAECVFRGVIFDVYQWQQCGYDGKDMTFEMLRRPDTVKVLAIKDNKLVINQEEQPNHWPYYDLPGGRHDIATETTLAAAQRELLEETGMSFRTWRLIRVMQPQGKVEQFIYLYVASDFMQQRETKHDGGEKITTHLMSLQEVKDLATRPDARHIPDEILDDAQSLEELLELPTFQGQEIDC